MRSLVCVLGWKSVDDLDGLDADADDLADEADDVFLFIRVVGVALDAAAFVGAERRCRLLLSGGFSSLI